MPQDAGVDLRASRYVFCLGDFIEPGDKRQLRDIGGWMGGLRIAGSDTEGAPSMWRSHYIIYRATFTPLESIVIPAKADIRDERLVKKLGNEFVMEVLPGQDMHLLGNESYRQQGVVEITALRDKIWNTGIAQDLNKIFFPDLEKWQSGTEDFPTLLSDYETIVEKVRPESDEIAQTRDQILESGRIFRAYASGQIEMNRQMVLQSRVKDMGGKTIRWSNRTRMFADQLGQTLEDDNVQGREKIVIRGDGVIRDPEVEALKTREIEAQEEANRLKKQELELKMKEYEEKAKEETKTKK